MDLSHIPHAFPCQEAHDEEVCEAVLGIVGRVVRGEEGEGGLTERAKL